MNNAKELSSRTVSKKGEPLPNGLKPHYAKEERWNHTLFSKEYQDELFDASNQCDLPLNHARIQSIDAVIMRMKIESPELFRNEALPTALVSTVKNTVK